MIDNKFDMCVIQRLLLCIFQLILKLYAAVKSAKKVIVPCKSSNFASLFRFEIELAIYISNGNLGTQIELNLVKICAYMEKENGG